MDHLYVVTYDIASPRRWRKVFRIMEGYGDWLQLSVFQCRLAKSRLLQLEAALADAMNQAEDHVIMLDLGPLEGVTPKVKSLGKAFRPVTREAVIVQPPGVASGPVVETVDQALAAMQVL